MKNGEKLLFLMNRTQQSSFLHQQNDGKLNAGMDDLWMGKETTLRP
jgi:hypothetical protein